MDIDLETKDRLKTMSDNMGIPQSQIVTFFLVYGFRAVDLEKVDLSNYLIPSLSPIWDHNLNIEQFKQDLTAE